MAPRPRLPDALLDGPFTTQQAEELGVSRRSLEGRSWRRLFPRVWVHVGRQLSHDDWVLAARATLPPDARPTSETRLRMLGLDLSTDGRLHFVVARDHHIATDGIMLHRTDRMPPLDDDGVTPAAAFIAYCAGGTLLEAVAVGDWLLHRGHMTQVELRGLAHRDAWREGAAEATWISDWLDERSRSFPESEVRIFLVAAGLPMPDVNVELVVGGRVVAILDLGYLAYDTAVEYEGGHHQTDRAQYLRDIERYGDLRDLGLTYVQVTKELRRRPRSMISAVYRAILAHGYTGPAPKFGRAWALLAGPIPTSQAVSLSPIRPEER